MNKQETISSWQLALIILAFLTGSSIVHIPSPLVNAANNGAWISIGLATGLAMLLLACLLYLNRKYPGMTFIGYSRQTLGKWLSMLIAIPFLLMILLDLSLIIIDLGGFLTGSMFSEMPTSIIHFAVIATAVLTARAGIEAMARMFTLLLFLMLGFVVLVLLLAIPNYHLEYLLPIFPKGFKPVLHGTYISFGFPNAEIIYFAMLIPLVRKEQRNKLSKFLFFAVIAGGFSLIVTTVSTIMVFGPMAGELKFSLFQLASVVSIQDIIERIETVIGMAVIVGHYMKITITMFILMFTLSSLLNLPDARSFSFPIAFLTLLLTLTMYQGEMEFVETVMVMWPLIITTIGVLPLIIITLIAMLKGNKSQTRKSERNEK